MNELDPNIITRAAHGDNSAFRSIVLHYGKAVNALAFRFTGQRESADDIAQDTFIKAHSALRSYRPEGHFSAWLLRIASNAAIDHIRKNKRHGSDCTVSSEQALPAVDPAPSADRRLHINRAIQQAMASLSDAERLAFTLKHHQGHSIAETARALKVNSNACKQTLFRAVQKLRRHLTTELI